MGFKKCYGRESLTYEILFDILKKVKLNVGSLQQQAEIELMLF
jgi:hypothetical protein